MSAKSYRYRKSEKSRRLTNWSPVFMPWLMNSNECDLTIRSSATPHDEEANMRQFIETVRKGSAVGNPKLDQWGDWRIKLRRQVAGRRVQVVVAVKADHFVIVTAI